jgi:hypothetical protein
MSAQVKADAYYHRPTNGFPFEHYDRRCDANYDPIRDSDHEVHRGCDVPLCSVEAAYARSDRAKSRESRRWYKRGEIDWFWLLLSFEETLIGFDLYCELLVWMRIFRLGNGDSAILHAVLRILACVYCALERNIG